MTAEVVAVGTELLLGQIVDTHSPRMARILADCGISCTHRQTVGDNFERIVDALRHALNRADVVITVGGLGPTADDLTRDAAAAALGDSMERSEEMAAKLREIFEVRKLRWTESILRQAEKPTSATFIDNPNGTAPGLICRKEGKTIVCLPGPKAEFNPMADGPVREFLSRMQGGQVIHSRVLRVCGMGESHVEELIRDLMDSVNPTVAPYAHPAEVHLRLTAKAESVDAAEALIEPMHQSIKERLGNAIYGTDDTPLEQAVIDLLHQGSATVAVAESMTGGGLGERFTSVSGSSVAFWGGVITYQVDAKADLLDLDKAMLDECGPVSSECAKGMATSIREKLGSTYALSITGNAGPTSDVDGKPVGLVYIGIAHPQGCDVKEIRFRGAREDIRRRASQAALVLLREELLKVVQ